MNVRSTSNPIVPSEAIQKAESPTVKMNESSQDRDADGRRHDQEPDKRPLNDEEMKKAKEYLDSLDGLKNNNLNYVIAEGDDMRVILIKDYEGNIVRRIPEHEMRLLFDHRDESSGNLFNKAG